MLFEALSNFSYMPQTLVEQPVPPVPPVTPIPVPAPQLGLTPQPTQPIQPTPTLTTVVQEKPRKPSLSEEVLTTRVLAEVRSYIKQHKF